MALRSLYVEPEQPDAEIDWPALEVRDVFKIYRSGPVETVALRGLELTVAKREIVAVLGPSGCGKSTFLALAAGLDQPSAGEVRSFGKSLSRMDESELATYRARDIALVFQSDNLWPALTAHANVLATLRLAGREGAGDAASAALDRVGLRERASHRVSELSGGEQQRVAIAAAAARGAPLVLADEPTGELDEVNERRVVDELLALRDSGGTVVVVTHSERVAARADRVIEMRDGKVAA